MIRQIRHLVAYDVRALRGPLVLWALVLVVEAVQLLLGPTSQDPGVGYVRFPVMTLAAYVTLVIRLALTVILTALIVQRDPLVGTTAFWLTRPIHRLELAASKFVSATLLVVLVPWLMMLAVLVALGLRPAGAVLGASVVAAEQVLAMIVAFVVAALTAGLAPFAIVLTAGAVLMSGGWILLVELVSWSPWVRDTAVGYSPGAFAAVGVAGAVAVVAYQYMSLRTRRSAGLVSGLLVVAVACGALWHAVRAEPLAPQLDPSILAPADVRLDADELAWSRTRDWQYGRLVYEWRVAGIVTVAGEPDALLLRTDRVDVSLGFGGRTVAADSRDVFGGGYVSSSAPVDGWTQPYRSLGVALGDPRILLPSFMRATRRHVVQFASITDDVARTLSGPGGLDATFRIRVLRYVIAARTPLQVGGRLVHGSWQQTIVRFGRGPFPGDQALAEVSPPARYPLRADRVRLVLRTTRVGPPPARRAWPPDYHLLLNQRRREAVILNRYGGPTYDASLGLVPGGAKVVTGISYCEFDPSVMDPLVSLDDEWLREAELVRVVPEELGVITRSLHVENVPAPGEK